MPRILIVDDDPGIREAVQVALELEGYEVVLAADGHDALERIRAGLRPCLIILDLMMPRMNGWEFRREQLNDPEVAKIPLAVVSGDGRIQGKAAELGTTVYLPKPMELDELLVLGHPGPVLGENPAREAHELARDLEARGVCGRSQAASISRRPGTSTRLIECAAHRIESTHSG